jgi:hypothetical protein
VVEAVTREYCIYGKYISSVPEPVGAGLASQSKLMGAMVLFPIQVADAL